MPIFVCVCLLCKIAECNSFHKVWLPVCPTFYLPDLKPDHLHVDFHPIMKHRRQLVCELFCKIQTSARFWGTDGIMYSPARHVP